MTRAHRFTLALLGALAVTATMAAAKLELTSGIRYVVADQPVSQCNTKAQTALNAYLSNVTETPEGSGNWTGSGPKGTTQNTARAVVRCYPVDKGYVATFTCAIQTPPNPYTAEILCLDVAHNFAGKQVYPLPTPTPPPSGCTTTNLVGTWTSDDNPKNVWKLDIDGNGTDQDGVTINWALDGNSASIVHYGTHIMTLSADGKHLSGDGGPFTRKC